MLRRKPDLHHRATHYNKPWQGKVMHQYFTAKSAELYLRLFSYIQPKGDVVGAFATRDTVNDDFMISICSSKELNQLLGLGVWNAT